MTFLIKFLANLNYINIGPWFDMGYIALMSILNLYFFILRLILIQWEITICCSDIKLLVVQLVARLTKDIVETYRKCNPEFKYSEELNLKRFLTSPSIGVLNDGYDNVNSDLILAVNSVLLNFDTQRRFVVFPEWNFQSLFCTHSLNPVQTCFYYASAGTVLNIL